MAYIEVKHLNKDFRGIATKGKQHIAHVLEEIDFEVEKGEFVSLLGFSGCGKSTILNLLAGFEKPTSGTITIDGKTIDKPTPRNITIFQHYGLLPWKNVIKNVELGLETQKLSKAERHQVASKYLELVGLKGFEHQFPARLSGGQQQRVAIARGLAVNPDVLFMDEPFGALDPIIRNKLQDDLLAIVKEQRKTVIFVTHDIDEAIYLSDRIFVMKANPGRIEETYNIRMPHPRDRSSKEFAHYRNLIYNRLFSIQERKIEYYI